MSAGGIAAIIFAVAFTLLVLVTCIILLKLGRVIDRAADAVVKGYPILDNASATVAKVNGEIDAVGDIRANVASVSGNVSALTSLFATTFGSPIVKVAAFSYGVRKAVGRKTTKDHEAVGRAQERAARAERKAARTGATR